MKVLVYTTLFPNHLQPNHGIFIKQRMFSFSRLKDCEIVVVAPVPYCPPWAILGRRYEYSRVKKYELMDGIVVYHPRYPLIPRVSMPLHGLSLFISSLCLARKIYQEFPFDLIDGHFVYPDGFASVLLGKILKKPVVLSARGSDINQFLRFRSIKPMIKYALTRANHIISVCSALKQGMIKLGIDSHKISVIPNGVDTRQFYPVGKRKARQRLAMANNAKVILSVGSLTRRKGFHMILEALSKLVPGDSNLHLYIIGEGQYRLPLERQIETLQLGRHVTLVGERPNGELRLWYSAADVFCLASFREGWPNVIMESLACATPVVATNVCGTPEILTSTDIGILVDPAPESLLMGLKSALEASWDREKIRAQVEDRGWSIVGDEVRALFSTILDRQFKDKQSAWP